FQIQVYKRINIESILNFRFEDIPNIMESCCKTFSFENLEIIQGKHGLVTKESIYNQLLIEKNGGLCFKLNSLLYYFLLDYGFNVFMVAGTVVCGPTPNRAPGCHVAVVMIHDNKKYFLDIGFGVYTAIKPVLISDGENENDCIVSKSKNGLFRIIKEKNQSILHTGETKNYTHTLQFKKDNNYVIEKFREW
ncbi:hypothetical protein DICPUDRAFT_19832, partial [Dictyostelium purpureum]